MKSNLQKTFLLLHKRAFILSALLLGVVHLSLAKSGKDFQSTKNVSISIDVKEVLLTEVFGVIKSQTDFVFSYPNNIVEDSKKYSFKFSKITVKNLLNKIGRQGSLEFKQNNNNISVRRKTEVLEKPIKTKQTSFQQKELSGTIIDSSTGQPLPGASIVVVNYPKIGAIADFDGNFNLLIPQDAKSILVSYVGFKAKEVSVTSEKLKVLLEPDVSSLDEVVVTALGIKREKKALGYAVAEVKGEEIANSGSSNVLTSLQGKGAGITITNTGAGVTGSSEIVLRGGSSLTGSNGALIVVDGVPFSNRSFGGGDIDFGSGIADLNPQDIESVSVLKGANAAALYGSRALNGVVMITTKKGKSGKPRFSYATQMRMTEIMYFPEIQNEYGAGSGSPDRFGLFLDDNGQAHTDIRDEKSWGPRLEGQLVRNDWLRDQPILPWVSHGDQHKDFFRTAVTKVQNIGITGGTEGMNYNLSMLYEDGEDVQPESTQDRYNIALRLGSKINDYVGLEGRIAYTHTKTHNRPTVGGRESVYYSLLQMPRSISLESLRPYRYPFSGQNYSYSYHRDGNKVAWNKGRNNPFWTIYEDQNNDISKRIVGFGKLNLKLLNDPDGSGTLSAFARVGWDNSEVNLETIRARSEAYTRGGLSITKNSYLELNSDFYLTYQKNLGKVGLTANFGGNRRYNEINFQSMWGSNFLTDNRTSSNNLESRDFQARTEKQALNSIYGSVQLAYDNYLFLDITGRNDWSSTLPAKNRSFFYPSVNLGFVATDAFSDLKSNVLDYAKFRASYAEVGNDLGRYRINTYYNYGTDTQGRLQATVQNSVGNENIEAEVNKSLEFGADFRFLKNRIGLDLTWYKSLTDNQIIGNYPQAVSTGFTSLLYNVGEISNTGLEFSLRTSPIKNKDWSWDLTMNYATNEMVLEELSLPGEAYYRIEDHIEYSSRAYVGQKFGDIYGYRYLRDKEGTVIVNEQGYPIIDNRNGSDSEVKVGNIQPDFTASLQSSLAYKNFSFSFLIDGSFGGDVFSGSKRELNRNGYSKESLQGREGWAYALDNDPRDLRAGGDKNIGSSYGGYDRWVGNSVFGVFDANGYIVLDANGEPMTAERNEGDNAMYINPERYWGEAARQGYRAVAGSKDGATEEYLEDGTFVKLREISLGYNLPGKWIDNLGLESVTLSAIGRNLFYLNKVSEFFDPDAYRKGTSINSLGYERNGALPSMRTYLLSLSVKF